MSVLRCVEGTNLIATETFVDEYEQPAMPLENSAGPLVRLLDGKDLITEVYATPYASEPGAWRVDLPVPQMDLHEETTLKLVWTFVDSEGERHRSSQQVVVIPSVQERTEDIIVMAGRDVHMTVVLPIHVDMGRKARAADVSKGIPARKAKEGDLLTLSVYRNNEPLMDNLPHTDVSVQVLSRSNQTVIRMPNVTGDAKLEPLLLYIQHVKKDTFSPVSYTFKVWVITPQILLASNSLEQFINKARLSNVIPELEYTQSDLIEYLSRGLNLFNSFLPILTNFNGTNMQGQILDGWLQCSAYYALSAQLQAEGAMAFDFSGAETQLNVDRTPAIEAALGRVESALTEYVKPMKALLGRAGVISGDGSQGGRFIDGSSQIGALSVTNSPTTRLPWSGRGASWSRGML